MTAHSYTHVRSSSSLLPTLTHSAQLAIVLPSTIGIVVLGIIVGKWSPSTSSSSHEVRPISSPSHDLTPADPQLHPPRHPPLPTQSRAILTPHSYPPLPALAQPRSHPPRHPPPVPQLGADLARLQELRPPHAAPSDKGHLRGVRPCPSRALMVAESEGRMIVAFGLVYGVSLALLLLRRRREGRERRAVFGRGGRESNGSSVWSQECVRLSELEGACRRGGRSMRFAR